MGTKPSVPPATATAQEGAERTRHKACRGEQDEEIDGLAKMLGAQLCTMRLLSALDRHLMHVCIVDLQHFGSKSSDTFFQVGKK